MTGTEPNAQLELLQGSAQTWECDAMGHLNVRFYVERAHEALHFLLIASGYEGLSSRLRDDVLREEFRTSTRAPFTVSTEHIRFHREVRPGTAFTLSGSWVRTEAGSRSEVAAVEMNSALDQQLCATFVFEVTGLEGLVDRARWAVRPRRASVPESARARGLEVGPAREDSSLNLDVANRLGLYAVHRRQFGVADGDAEGRVRPAALMGCLSDGVPHLVGKLRGEDRGSAASAKIGGAALEYRFVYRRQPRIGDLVEVRSGLAGLGGKTQHFVHWLLDPVTGAAWATAEAIAVSFDLVARRAVAIDGPTRKRLQARLVEGLTL